MANPRPPAWDDKVKSGNLMSRILKHANGDIEMTKTQLDAAKIYLSKTIADLSRIDGVTKHEGGITIEVVQFGDNKTPRK